MKKLMLLAAGIVASMLFAGCALTGAPSNSSPATSGAAPTAQNPAAAIQQAAENLQDAVLFACDILQPTIQPFAPLLNATPALATFNGDFSLACSINSALNLTSINSLISSSIVAAQAVVSSTSSLNQTDQALINAALGAFQGSLKLALANYNAAVATAALPASATPADAAASPPVAASQ